MPTMPERVVEEAGAAGCASIAYTYSEPTTFYEYTLDTSRLARERGIRNLLKSNGYINERPLRHLSRFLDAANIDLKSFSASTYRRLSEGALEPVLRTLKVLREEGVWLEITCLVIPEWTDDQGEIARMCAWLCEGGLADAPLHFSRFVPLYKLTQLPATPVSALEEAQAVARRAGMQYVYIGNVPGHASESTGRASSISFRSIHSRIPVMKSREMEAMRVFREIQRDAGYVVTTRKTRGDDIDAVCGQLAGKVADKSGRVMKRMHKEAA